MGICTNTQSLAIRSSIQTLQNYDYQNDQHIHTNITLLITQTRNIFFNQIQQLNIIAHNLFKQLKYVQLIKHHNLHQSFKKIKGRWKKIKMILQLIKNQFPQVKKQYLYQKEMLEPQGTSQYVENLKIKDRNGLVKQLQKQVLIIYNESNQVNKIILTISQNTEKFDEFKRNLNKILQKWILISSLLYCLCNENQINILQIKEGNQIKLKKISSHVFHLNQGQSIYMTQDIQSLKSIYQQQTLNLKEKFNKSQLTILLLNQQIEKQQNFNIKYLDQIKQYHQQNLRLTQEIYLQKQLNERIKMTLEQLNKQNQLLKQKNDKFAKQRQMQDGKLNEIRERSKTQINYLCNSELICNRDKLTLIDRNKNNIDQTQFTISMIQEQYESRIKNLAQNQIFLAEQNKQLKQQIKIYNMKIATLQQQNQKIQKQIKIVQQINNQLKLKNQQIIKQINTRQKLNQNQQTVKRTLLQIEQLKDQIQKNQNSNEQQLRELTSDLEYDISRLGKQNQDHRKLLKQMDIIILHYKQKESQMILEERQLKQKKDENILLRQQISRLMKQVEEATISINELQNKISNLINQNQKIILDKNNLRVKVQKLEKQKTEQQQMKRNIVNLEDKIIKLVQDNQISKISIEELNNNISNYISRETDIILENQALKNSIKILQSKNQELDNQFELTRQQNKKINIIVEELSSPSHIVKTIFPGSEIISTLELKRIFRQFSELSIHNSKFLYRATQKDFKKFHSLCNHKNSIIVLILAENGNICGGFTDIAFKSESHYQLDHKRKSFLFRIKNNQFTKLKILDKKNPIIYDESSGPIFGESQLRVKDRICYTNYGVSNGRYFKDPKIENCKTFFGGTQQFKIKEYEVYQLSFQ